MVTRSVLLVGLVLVSSPAWAVSKALECDIAMSTNIKTSASDPGSPRSERLTRIYVIDDAAQTVHRYDSATGAVKEHCPKCTLTYGPKKIVLSEINFDNGFRRFYEQSWDRLSGANSLTYHSTRMTSGFESIINESGTCKLTAMPAVPTGRF